MDQWPRTPHLSFALPFRHACDGLLPSRKALPILSDITNSETSNSTIPTLAQLTETRLKQWHQTGEALLTIENLRGWINAAGLVLFAPRPQIASAAPSLVEAVLGAPNAVPTIEQTAEARSLLARVVAEGLAVPLNLLGPGAGTVHAAAPGDAPDFVASTAVFSYIFTLRGDKAWKQPPPTAGAIKVSQLASATYEALERRGPLSAYDLMTEVGKEVTEAAVLRALGELWTHLRVLPLAQPDGAATLWELASARFTKQIKAGANAGQPSALSALISLYLGQAVVAAEDEIESFLSPLAARSRIRDVIHALLAARELETVAVEGRTMLHVAGSLPSFLATEVAVSPEAAIEVAAADAEGEEDVAGEAGPRITKFVAKPRKIGTGYLAKAKPSKSATKSFSDVKPRAFGSKPPLRRGVGAGSAPDRERRPFIKAKPGGFDKPWDEEKTRRLTAARKPSEVAEDGPAASSLEVQPRAARVYKPRTDRPERSVGGDSGKFAGKPAFGRKPSFGDKPAFGGKSRFSGEDRPPRREFAARGEGDARPAKKTFSKPGTFGRKREGFAARASGEDRPPRREFSPRPEGRSDRRPGPRPDRSERPAFGGSRSAGSYASRPQGDRPGRPARNEGGGFGVRKPFSPRSAEGGSVGKPRYSKDGFAGQPRTRDDRGTSTESGKRVYRKFDAPRDRPARPFSADRPARSEGSIEGTRKPGGDFAPRKFSGKPAGKPDGFGKSSGRPGGFAKKSFAKSDRPFKGKPESTFAKFAGNKKPFGKRPPGRKFKPGAGESA
jgi:23S rRNA pseudouridine2605 synthase